MEQKRYSERRALTGTAEDDILRGFGGNDPLLGLGGNDTLESGDYVIAGGAGDDGLRGGNGNDAITDFEAIDQIQIFGLSEDVSVFSFIQYIHTQQENGVDSDVEIELDTGTITLEDMKFQLEATNFLFGWQRPVFERSQNSRGVDDGDSPFFGRLPCLRDNFQELSVHS